MTRTSNKIVFFGTEDFSATSLRALIDAGFDVAAIVTKPDSKKGRGQKVTPPLVKSVALAHDIPVWQPSKLTEIVDDIQSLQPVAGVLVSFGKIIPQSIIDMFSPGIINLHPSLLPNYRGPSPIESAIKHGDDRTGVSIMLLSAAMDAGPVYTQVDYRLTGDETQPELYNALATLGAKTLTNALPAIFNKSLQPIPQDDTKATYCELLQKTDTYINTGQLSAVDAERHVRAHISFPKTKLTVLGQDIIITKARVSKNATNPLDIKCQDGLFLSIQTVIAPSGRTMTAESFLNGYAD